MKLSAIQYKNYLVLDFSEWDDTYYECFAVNTLDGDYSRLLIEKGNLSCEWQMFDLVPSKE